jgi:hypothetical protein
VGPLAVFRILGLLVAVVGGGCGRVGYGEKVMAAAPDVGVDLAPAPRPDGAPAVDAAPGPEAGALDSPAPEPGDAPAAPDAGPETTPVLPDAAIEALASDLPPPAGDGPPPLTSNTTVVYSAAATAPWLLNGAAVTSGTALQVTTAAPNQAGSAYLDRPFGLRAGTSFGVQFAFRVYGGNRGPNADGFTLVWQNAPQGPAALGDPGGSLGYEPMRPSVAVEVDEQYNSLGDPNGNHIAVDLTGSVTAPHAVADTLPFMISDGLVHNVWVDYDGTAHMLKVYVASSTTKPATPILTDSIDLVALVGNRAYLGFTGGCGQKDAIHEIESVSVTFSY